MQSEIILNLFSTPTCVALLGYKGHSVRNVYPPPDAQLFGQVHYQLPFSFIDNRLVVLAITSTVCFKVGSPAPPLPNKSVFSFFYVSTGNSAGIEGWEATEWHKFKHNPIYMLILAFIWHLYDFFERWRLFKRLLEENTNDIVIIKKLKV